MRSFIRSTFRSTLQCAALLYHHLEVLCSAQYTAALDHHLEVLCSAQLY